MKKKAFLSAGEVTRAVGVSVTTIYRWDKADLLPTTRTATNQHWIPVEGVERIRRAEGRANAPLHHLCAGWVSSAKQEQDGNVTRQGERPRSAAREWGYHVVALITEHASSPNEKRKGLKNLSTLIDQQAFDVVLIA
jgi:predicted site-specific integrase-resolvase